MINWNMRSYTKEEFIEAWKTGFTYTEVLRNLGLNQSGGSQKLAKKTAEDLGLSNDHFSRKPKIVPTKYSLEEILVDSPSYNGGNVNLRKRLVQAGLKENKCENCGLSEWMGKPMPLCLDHVNGNNRDFRIENLQVLCQNCHAQTPTWCGKNKVRKASNGFLPGENLKKYFCKCGKQMTTGAVQCRECYDVESQGKDSYPSTKILVSGVEKMGYVSYAKTIGLSDNGLRKLLKRRKVAILPKRCYSEDIK